MIASLPGDTINLGVKAGLPMEKLKHTVTYRTKIEKRVLRDERGPEHFGVAYIASAVPVFDNPQNTGEPIGYLTAVTSIKSLQELRANAHELAATVEQLSATTDEIANASSSISHDASSLADYVGKMSVNVKNISEIVKFVQEISSQSNLLGLNAAIEAARAGEAGRGFGVVSDEIRKMATQSKDSAGKIRQMAEELQNALNYLNDTVKRVADNQMQHSESVNELRAVFEHIANVASSLSQR